MIKKPKWIVFDIGNVLYDFIAFNKVFAKITDINEELLINSVELLSKGTMEGQISAADLFKKYLKYFNKEDKHNKIVKIWETEEKFWLSDTKKLLRELNKSDYRIAILTNNWLNQTKMLKANLSKYANIEFYFESSVEKISKPDYRIYQLVEERTEAKGNDILFIDDTQSYISGAEKLG